MRPTSTRAGRHSASASARCATASARSRRGAASRRGRSCSRRAKRSRRRWRRSGGRAMKRGRGRERGARESTLETRGREQARAFLLEARKTVEAALAQARAAVDEATAREARRQLEAAIEQTRQEERSGHPGAGPRGQSTQALAVGDSVETASGRHGRVEELRADGRVAVQVGSIRLVLDPSELRPAPHQPSKEDRAISLGGLTPGPRPGVGTEVSLRGLRADEAEAILLKALDDAVLDDLPYLRIIHGKGTGALRDLVQRLLTSDPRVSTFALAPANQGGSGVTIAEFRA